MKVLIAALAVVTLAACNPNLRPTVDDLREKVAQLERQVEAQRDELAKAERFAGDAKRWRREAARMTSLVEERDRTISLFEACLQNIIDETNRIDFVYQYGRALRTAFNGANCSALGYYWG